MSILTLIGYALMAYVAILAFVHRERVALTISLWSDHHRNYTLLRAWHTAGYHLKHHFPSH